MNEVKYVHLYITHNEHFQRSDAIILDIDDNKDDSLCIGITDMELQKIRNNELEYSVGFIYKNSNRYPDGVVIFDDNNEDIECLDEDCYCLGDLLEEYDEFIKELDECGSDDDKFTEVLRNRY